MRLITYILLTLSISFNAYADDKQLFVGAWDMIKFELKDENNQWPESVIKNTTLVESLVYTASGIMHVQMFSADRDNAELNDNNEEIVNSYSGYFGHYSLDLNDKTVTYNRIGHLVSEFIEQVVTRHYDVGDDYLHIYNSPTARMRWKRVK